MNYKVLLYRYQWLTLSTCGNVRTFKAARGRYRPTCCTILHGPGITHFAKSAAASGAAIGCKSMKPAELSTLQWAQTRCSQRCSQPYSLETQPAIQPALQPAAQDAASHTASRRSQPYSQQLKTQPAIQPAAQDAASNTASRRSQPYSRRLKTQPAPCR